MYVIEIDTYPTVSTETFNCSEVAKFFERIKQLRESNHTILSTYFED